MYIEGLSLPCLSLPFLSSFYFSYITFFFRFHTAPNSSTSIFFSPLELSFHLPASSASLPRAPISSIFLSFLLLEVQFHLPHFLSFLSNSHFIYLPLHLSPRAPISSISLSFLLLEVPFHLPHSPSLPPPPSPSSSALSCYWRSYLISLLIDDNSVNSQSGHYEEWLDGS